jgi:hypothetical protein
MKVSDFIKIGDKRTKKYKDIAFLIDCLESEYGKDSQIVKDTYNEQVEEVLK